MAPAPISPLPEQPGPHPSYIQVAKPFLFEQKIQSQILSSGANPQREDVYRLQGVQWLDDVRRALQLPVRTFNTAVVYYHKFRIVHKDTEYNYPDAAAAALFSACKIEDTLKKSKEILCAAHNLKVSPSEHLTPDDGLFEGPSKIVIGLERLMLEASGFDYRNRHPQKYLLKLAKKCGMDKDVTRTAYKMLLDLYRTFAPLKQSSAAMAFGCLELSTRLLDKQLDHIRGEKTLRHNQWKITRQQIMETMMDLLDLYTHFQKSTSVGPTFAIDTFIKTRIALNQETDERKASRYAEWKDAKQNGLRTNVKTPKTPITPTSPTDIRVNGRDIASPATLSPRSSSSGRRGPGARGQEGTIRFMLDGAQAKREKAIVSEYFKTEYEDYEVEVDEPAPARGHPNPHSHLQRPRYDRDERNGRDDRYGRQFKRPRR
ncbi:MAG: RNA polymerase II C-terminal domain kinase beta subunit [Claussenomyces sp. TS43310]|nr:MAG: RNA polymerase II C-terminal domain kinase beta subunit [Claussenomyces sp. TS43310]